MPDVAVVLAGLLAMLTVQMFRVTHAEVIPLLVAEVIVFAALPCIAFGLLRSRFRSQPNWLNRIDAAIVRAVAR